MKNKGASPLAPISESVCCEAEKKEAYSNKKDDFAGADIHPSVPLHVVLMRASEDSFSALQTRASGAIAELSLNSITPREALHGRLG